MALLSHPRHGNCTIDSLQPLQDVNTAFEVQRPNDKTAVVIIPDIFAEAVGWMEAVFNCKVEDFSCEKYCYEELGC